MRGTSAHNRTIFWSRRRPRPGTNKLKKTAFDKFKTGFEFAHGRRESKRWLKTLKAAFTRQTKVGKFVLANSSWCVWTAQKQSANTFYLSPTVCQRVCLLFLCCLHTPTWVCQHEFANYSLPCEGCFTRTWKCTHCIMQKISYLYASDFPFKNSCKLSRHATLHNWCGRNCCLLLNLRCKSNSIGNFQYIGFCWSFRDTFA